MVTTDAQRMMAACHLAIADLRDVVTQLPPQQPDGRADAAAVAKRCAALDAVTKLCTDAASCQFLHDQGAGRFVCLLAVKCRFDEAVQVAACRAVAALSVHCAAARAFFVEPVSVVLKRFVQLQQANEGREGRDAESARQSVEVVMSTLVALLNHRDSGRAVEALAKEGICEAVVSALRTHGQVSSVVREAAKAMAAMAYASAAAAETFRSLGAEQALLSCQDAAPDEVVVALEVLATSQYESPPNFKDDATTSSGQRVGTAAARSPNALPSLMVVSPTASSSDNGRSPRRSTSASPGGSNNMPSISPTSASGQQRGSRPSVVKLDLQELTSAGAAPRLTFAVTAPEVIMTSRLSPTEADVAQAGGRRPSQAGGGPRTPPSDLREDTAAVGAPGTRQVASRAQAAASALVAEQQAARRNSRANEEAEAAKSPPRLMRSATSSALPEQMQSRSPVKSSGKQLPPRSPTAQQPNTPQELVRRLSNSSAAVLSSDQAKIAMGLGGDEILTSGPAKAAKLPPRLMRAATASGLLVPSDGQEEGGSTTPQPVRRPSNSSAATSSDPAAIAMGLGGDEILTNGPAKAAKPPPRLMRAATASGLLVSSGGQEEGGGMVKSPNASKQPSVRNTQAVSLLSSSSNGRGAPTTPDAQQADDRRPRLVRGNSSRGPRLGGGGGRLDVNQHLKQLQGNAGYGDDDDEIMLQSGNGRSSKDGRYNGMSSSDNGSQRSSLGSSSSSILGLSDDEG